MSEVSLEIFDRLRIMEIKQSTHEAVCVERYGNLLNAADKMERSIEGTNRLLIGGGIALLCGMAGILAKIVFG
jgi:hypothetical protein